MFHKSDLIRTTHFWLQICKLCLIETWNKRAFVFSAVPVNPYVLLMGFCFCFFIFASSEISFLPLWVPIALLESLTFIVLVTLHCNFMFPCLYLLIDGKLF